MKKRIWDSMTNLYSFGPDLDNEKGLVVRVDEGQFKGTVFSIDKLSVLQEEDGLLDVQYTVRYSPDEQYLQANVVAFRDNVITKVVTDVLESATKKATQESR